MAEGNNNLKPIGTPLDEKEKANLADLDSYGEKVAKKWDNTTETKLPVSEISNETVIYEQYINEINNSLFSNSGRNQGIVNIITDYPWSVNYRSQKVYNKVPAVHIREFQQSKSTFSTSLRWMGGTVTDKIDDIGVYNSLLTGTKLYPYKNMYALKDTGIKYVFPYYGIDQDISLINNYGDQPTANNLGQNSLNEVLKFGTNVSANLQNMGQLIDTFNNNSGGAIANGVYVERPKYFQVPSGYDSITVKFTLYNTIDISLDSQPNSIIPWVKNFNLIKALTVKNLPFKATTFKFVSPVLYQVSCPGYKYFPISYISSFGVTPKGIKTLAQYNGKDVLVPEAWDFNIKFTSLLLPSANLALAGLHENNKIINII